MLASQVEHHRSLETGGDPGLGFPAFQYGMVGIQVEWHLLLLQMPTPTHLASYHYESITFGLDKMGNM